MEDLASAVRRGLAARADPSAAPGMQRYMKSTMPFRGVAKPAREELVRELVAARPAPTPAEFAVAVRALWDGAEYREERYVALTLTGHRRWAPPQDASWVPLYRHWIVTGAWWDFTDEIASKRIGVLLRAAPAELSPVLRAWAGDGDRWLRRTAVIAQLGSGTGTDLDLLRHAIETNLADPDFFLRKGIGWALRQHARVDPGWVREFVTAHPGLSSLSRREALRHLG
ncbi:DNA alkylation repair protein [Pseudonocardia sp.]|uniref:DNA alkylation repair protein n=1 Tax=Pseudonocardia sp. TaxID=60912 RepID=UPI00261DFEC5|nr:DNA alkylation repair protein [Pseudonocardia sp.]